MGSETASHSVLIAQSSLLKAGERAEVIDRKLHGLVRSLRSRG